MKHGLRVEAIFTDGSRWVAEIPTRDEKEALKIGRAKAAEISPLIAAVRLSHEQHAPD